MQHDIIAAGGGSNLDKEKVQSDPVELPGFILKFLKPIIFKGAVLKYCSKFWLQTLKIFTDTNYFLFLMLT